MRFAVAALAVMMVSTSTALAQTSTTLTSDETAKVDAAVKAAFDKSGVPSAVVGIRRGGSLVYTRAFGNAIVEKALPAQTTMAYPVGSISKQFTAACILLLQEQGKLKLDDPVSKWFPEFTRANEVTIRNLLTHTSGYSDYAPQDYTIPAWTKPIDSYKLIREWATKPLDFDPGTRWQYSNTNFQMAALIVEKITGQPFHNYLWANVIQPLKLEGVLDLDTDRTKLKPHGYERHALSPPRPAILEAPGWYSGDAILAMPVATLLAWDESIVHRTLLKPESYDAMETDFKLKDGSSSHYGLGVFVAHSGGKTILFHGGEVGGFVSNNVVDLTDDIAYAALTNFEGPGADAITSAIRPILIASPPRAVRPAAAPEQTSVPAAPVYTPAPAEQAKAILTSLQTGKIDRSLFTPDANFYFSNGTLSDFATSLAPLGPIVTIAQTSEALRGGMTYRTYDVKFATRTLSLNSYTQKDGRIEQFLVNGD
ncbi:penicillin-binding protein, beta-lactamase class C [Terriglobus roseus DSM 18391]|uniref:Penicillin-binding protein, beta-lactamase class C n=1 Tax=Terriglobus roseus (strain DSM 18391 / NRRL B-41598 / KBS 63) TaxID=926566 RepID=I3ZM21_TERRK|nr:serine hydrolase domain-containing protein [Terriglobus roseus]AFL90289.1 penicillin-binding protein, beta-lactamase class C [Terriglobus roseus DSM 18391]